MSDGLHCFEKRDKRCGNTKKLHCFNKSMLLGASTLKKKLKDGEAELGDQRLRGQRDQEVESKG